MSPNDVATVVVPPLSRNSNMPSQVREEAHSASRSGAVSFLAPPPAMVAQLRAGADSFASDGMHPNDAGYRV